jgi:uncharacterized protein with PIN domain
VNPTRFVTDASLDLVARRLRMLGYDVRGLRGARLEELLTVAAEEDRIVLTASARHPRRFADVRVVRLPREDPATAVRMVADSHPPAGPPFSRCPLCNSSLQKRHPLEASGEVPGRVLRAARSLAYCPQCGKWYWDGSHIARIRSWLSTTLGREVPGPE